MDVDEPITDIPIIVDEGMVGSSHVRARQEVAPTRSGRRRYFPPAFKDFIPYSRTALPHIPEPPRQPMPLPLTSSLTPSPSPPPAPIIFETEPNEFGLYRTYMTFPTTDPEAERTLDDVCNAPLNTSRHAPLHSSSSWQQFKAAFNTTRGARENIFHPFQNATIFRLMNWFYNGSNTKTIAELNLLVKNVLLADDFNIDDLQNFSAIHELQRLDIPDETAVFSAEAGWKESSVNLRLPINKGDKEEKAPEYTVPGVWHRDLVDVIHSALQSQKASSYHFTPSRLWYKPTPHSEPERVITDLYNSDAYLEEHEDLQKRPKEPGCDLERLIVALMPWSDSTHLANFGQASL